MHFRFFLLFEFDFDLSGVWAGGRGDAGRATAARRIVNLVPSH